MLLLKCADFSLCSEDGVCNPIQLIKILQSPDSTQRTTTFFIALVHVTYKIMGSSSHFSFLLLIFFY
jgi:hypothetical protein